ncbi:hypothetical protein ACMF9N_001830, partial [Campylobacter jejuni]
HPGAYGPDDPGGGPYDPETGLRDWYAPQTNAPGAPGQKEEPVPQITLVDVLTHWIPITLDLHERFGVDTESGILHQRTWFWLKDRILDLLDSPSRLRAALGLPDDITTA